LRNKKITFPKEKLFFNQPKNAIIKIKNMPASKNFISFYGIWPEMQKYLKSISKGLTFTTNESRLTEQNINPKTTILATFVETPIDKKIMDSLPNLKMIAAMSTGFDHIDLKAAKEKNIVVCNVPSYGEVTVAEHTMALMLALSRKIFASVKKVKEGAYDFHGLRGSDLQGKILGVIGTGKIGVQVIKRATAFDMKVVAYDPFPNKLAEREFDFSYVTLDKLLSSADFITLHVPLLPTTYHLINKKNITKIKQGAYLINTARGALVEPAALLGALKSKRLTGTALDVLEDENLIEDEEQIIQGKPTLEQLKTNAINKMLIEHPNAIITPHNAFNSTEALERIVGVTIQNIRAFCKGTVQNRVGE
jgi:D-lactate dehydrogenase